MKEILEGGRTVLIAVTLISLAENKLITIAAFKMWSMHGRKLLKYLKQIVDFQVPTPYTYMYTPSKGNIKRDQKHYLSLRHQSLDNEFEIPYTGVIPLARNVKNAPTPKN